MLPRVLKSSVASLLIVGGCTERREGGALRSVELLEVDDKDAGLKVSTRNVATLKQPRRSPSLVYDANGQISVLGGCRAEYDHLNCSEILSMNNGSWTATSTNIKVPPHSCASFCNITNSIGLIVGGFDGTDCLKKVMLVDRKNGHVTNLPDVGSRLKNSFAVTVDQKSCLLFGGWNESQTMRTVFRLTLNDDLSSHSFEMDGLLPFPVEGHACVQAGDYVYLVGGYDGLSVVNRIVQYNTRTKTSHVLPVTLSIARENHVCGLFMDKYLVVAGGWDGKNSLDSIEIFLLLPDAPFLEKIPCETRLTQPRNRPSAIQM